MRPARVERVMVEGPVVAPGEVHEERHDLAEAAGGRAYLVTLGSGEQRPVVEGDKRLAEIVNLAAHSHELQLAQRSPLVRMLMRR
jgi:hypothetical protein